MPPSRLVAQAQQHVMYFLLLLNTRSRCVFSLPQSCLDVTGKGSPALLSSHGSQGVMTWLKTASNRIQAQSGDTGTISYHKSTPCLLLLLARELSSNTSCSLSLVRLRWSRTGHASAASSNHWNHTVVSLMCRSRRLSASSRDTQPLLLHPGVP